MALRRTQMNPKVEKKYVKYKNAIEKTDTWLVECVHLSLPYKQCHLIDTNFISTQYLTFQNSRTIFCGFGEIKRGDN